MFEARTTDELIRIAMAGGGFEIKCGARTTDDLVRIAMAAKGSGANIYMKGLAARATDELIRIAMAGGGAVVFADKYPEP